MLALATAIWVHIKNIHTHMHANLCTHRSSMVGEKRNKH